MNNLRLYLTTEIEQLTKQPNRMYISNSINQRYNFSQRVNNRNQLARQCKTQPEYISATLFP